MSKNRGLRARVNILDGIVWQAIARAAYAFFEFEARLYEIAPKSGALSVESVPPSVRRGTSYIMV